MYCTKCGIKNDDDSRFCTKCGTELQNIDIGTTKKITNKDIRRFGKINIKNRNVLIIAILGIVIIISVALIFLFNNHGINGDIEEPTVVQGTDTTIVIDEQGKNVPNKETVEVSISSIPSGANIYINNISRGKAPIKINLPEGNYSLKMNLTGYMGIRSEFNVTRDMERQNIDVTFEPEKINESISKTTDETINESINKTTNETINESINKTTNETTNETINKTTVS